jgi:hypothetical protein
MSGTGTYLQRLYKPSSIELSTYKKKRETKMPSKMNAWWDKDPHAKEAYNYATSTVRCIKDETRYERWLEAYREKLATLRREEKERQLAKDEDMDITTWELQAVMYLSSETHRRERYDEASKVFNISKGRPSFMSL